MWTLMCQQNQIELYSEKKKKVYFQKKKEVILQKRDFYSKYGLSYCKSYSHSFIIFQGSESKKVLSAIE